VKGSIKRRSEGSWTIIYDLTRASSGKRRKKFETVRGTKKEAEKLLAQRIHEVNSGKYVEDTPLTLEDFLWQWLTAHAATEVSPATYVQYEQLVRNHIAPKLGKHRVDKITPLQIKTFYAEARKSGRKDGQGGLSGATVRHFHILLKQAFKQGIRWRVIRENPCDLLDAPQIGHQDRHPVDEATLVQLLDAAQGTTIWIPVVLAAGTGMRRGEVCALRWKDVNLKEGELQVRHSLSVTKGKLTLKQPKTDKGLRPIPLPSFLVEALVQHRASQRARIQQLGSAYEDNDLVVERGNGKYLYPDQISHGFRDLTRQLGIKMRFHDLRHTHATLLIKYGENIKVVSERLGHAGPGVTLAVYTHIDQEQHRGAADRIDALVRGAEQKGKDGDGLLPDLLPD
jgi:integrase